MPKKSRIMEPDVHANLHVPSEASASSNLNKFSKPTALPCQDLHLKNDAFFLEICAGSARVTSCLQHLGLKASFGVDHKRQKNAGRLLVADLTSKEGQALCWKWIRSPNCVGIFVAPPCGTCSRARGIPIRLPHGKTIPGPMPLRSDQFPDGLPSLVGVNRVRVNAANALYKFIIEICLFCINAGLTVCIENPRSSIYWRTSFFRPLVPLLTFTIHQACAYGSQRPKWTALAHNTITLKNLNLICPGLSATHKHHTWGLVDSKTFSTAEETAYPMKLAFHIALFLTQHVVQLGWLPPSTELQPPDDISYQYLRAITGVQPKSSKLPPLVSEFAYLEDLDVCQSSTPPVLPGENSKKHGTAFPLVPACSKNLRCG